MVQKAISNTIGRKYHFIFLKAHADFIYTKQSMWDRTCLFKCPFRADRLSFKFIIPFCRNSPTLRLPLSDDFMNMFENSFIHHIEDKVKLICSVSEGENI